MTTKTAAILLTDAGIYGDDIEQAMFRVLQGTIDENGTARVKGSEMILTGCMELQEEGGQGWDPEFEYAIPASMYELLNDDVQPVTIKLLNDSLYDGAGVTGITVQAFHIDAVLGGPEGYAVQGSELYSTQDKFPDDAFIYLWEVGAVEVQQPALH